MKKFITFGGGGQNYIDAGNRLIKQALNLNLFDEVKLYTDKDLIDDIDFWSKHKDFILNNKRGYGYWLWKPYVIKKTMEQMKEDDILLYLDCGCELNELKIQNLINFFNYIKTDYIIGTLAGLEKEWNKMDLLKYLNMENDYSLDINQRQAGTNMFLVCEKVINLVNEWYNISCIYNLIDDSNSISKNFDCFKEHRHDQSIFSLLTKKYNIYSTKNLHDCIYCIRNTTSISKI